MKSKKNGSGYNERLFSGGLRRRLHLARFHWVADAIARLQIPLDSVFELGCFDGKLLDFLPAPPGSYLGVDAGWEQGLAAAQQFRAGQPSLRFARATVPDEIPVAAREKFTLAVAMETLEHLSPELCEAYLEKIARHLDGYLLVTVPNEIGPVFLSKWLIKKLFSRDNYNYSLRELVNATFGRSSRIARHKHKGFDYRVLLESIGQHFEIVEVSGHPAGFLPACLCFGIGIIARSRPRSHQDRLTCRNLLS